MADYSSSFRAKRRQHLFHPSLVDLDHVTHTCPTGLRAYRAIVDPLHARSGINTTATERQGEKKKKKKERKKEKIFKHK